MPTDFLNDTVKVTIDNRVAKIELNHPEILNKLNKEMVKELVHSLKEISINDEINIVVITGKEGAFSASSPVMNEIQDEDHFYHMMETINELIVTLYSMPKITITAVNGLACGLGFSLALATDHILVSKSSQLAMNQVRMGLIPDGGTHFFLERRLGEDKAKHLIWDERTMSAEEALQFGLINEIAEGDLQQAVEEKIHKWLNSPVQAMIKSKKILAEKNRPHLLKMLELEKFAQYKMRLTEDYREGYQAMQEKRQPNFIGK